MKKTIAATLVALTALVIATPAGAAKKPKTPAACITALNAAQEGFSVAADFAGSVADYVDSLRAAAKVAADAGGTTTAVGVFLQTQASLLNTLTAQASTQSDALTSPMEIFRVANQKCRASV